MSPPTKASEKKLYAGREAPTVTRIPRMDREAMGLCWWTRPNLTLEPDSPARVCRGQCSEAALGPPARPPLQESQKRILLLAAGRPQSDLRPTHSRCGRQAPPDGDPMWQAAHTHKDRSRSVCKLYMVRARVMVLRECVIACCTRMCTTHSTVYIPTNGNWAQPSAAHSLVLWSGWRP